MALVGDNVSEPVRIAIHLSVFIFCVAAVQLIKNIMIPVDANFEAAVTHVLATYFFAIVLILMGRYDVGFLFGGIGVLAIGVFGSIWQFSDVGKLGVMAGALAITIGSGMFLNMQPAPPAAAKFVTFM